MKLRIVCGVLALAFSTVLAGFSAAADAPPPPKSESPAEEFQRLHSELKTVLAELSSLQKKFRTANEDKQDEIRLQWKDTVARGEAIEPKLIDAAERAYSAAPNADMDLTNYLVMLLHIKTQRDEYETAAKIGKLLTENGCKAKGVANLAGIAAVAVGDFDFAEKCLTQADKEGAYKSLAPEDQLGEMGALYLQSIGYYKKAWAKEEALRKREATLNNLPHVLLKTNKGDIELELFEDQAPNTVANFISLVEKGFYKDVPFHRVLPNFMAQGGDPTGTGGGGPGYAIACECYRPDYRLHFRGSLSMAHAGRDTGGSQFFLTFLPTRQLDGKHTVFGRVVSGMDVLAKIQRRDPEKPEQPRPDKILDAKIIRKRPHDYRPEKLPE
jgi:cyclophilin family peptidyl-prolyl cis-trans isomerase